MRPRTQASLKAALLGLGHPHSAAYLNTLNNLPEVSGIFLWDETRRPGVAGSLPRSPKVELVTPDLDRLLARSDLDFAIVCARTDQAADIGRRVVEAGKHLLTEKPGGMDPGEISGVIQAARRAGVCAGVLYANRFQPAMREAHKLFSTGTIGRLLSAEARMLTTQVRFRDPKVWFFHRRHAGGGILTWLGCHFIDLLQHVSGDRITAVCAHEATLSGEKIDVEDSAALALRFASGAVGTFHAGYTLAHSGGGFVNASGYDTYLAWNGQEGRIVWPGLVPRLHVESPVASGPAVREKFFRPRKTTSYGGAGGEAFIRQFIAATRGRAELPASLENALSVARVIEAAERSAATGRLVAVRG